MPKEDFKEGCMQKSPLGDLGAAADDRRNVDGCQANH